MSIFNRIHKNGIRPIATATGATVATVECQSIRSVANVAIVAVANPPEPKNDFLSIEDESAIHNWFDFIQETDSYVISEMIERCRSDPGTRDYFIPRVRDLADTNPFPDDRRNCNQCMNLSSGGRCLAALRGEIQTGKFYHPLDNCPRRCVGYRPKSDDPDQRTGRERWPNLNQQLYRARQFEIHENAETTKTQRSQVS